MSGGQRLVMLALALVVLVLAVVLIRPDSSEDEQAAEQVTPTATAVATQTATAAPEDTPTPSPTPSPKPTVDPGPILTGEEVVKLRFDKGETVRFRVKAPEDEEVHVHGYDISKDVKAGKVTKMSFEATIDGIFEIEFEHSGTEIAQLRVDP